VAYSLAYPNRVRVPSDDGTEGAARHGARVLRRMNFNN
jgi:hypothetical protein